MTGNILKPDAFNERFTIYLNTEGKPVQRPLREMTAAEVMMAFHWIEDECERLDKLTAPKVRLIEANPATLSGEERSELAEMNARMRVGDQEDMRLFNLELELAEKRVRLHRLICALVPQYGDNSTPLREAVMKWWPGGRHAA